MQCYLSLFVIFCRVCNKFRPAKARIDWIRWSTLIIKITLFETFLCVVVTQNDMSNSPGKLSTFSTSTCPIAFWNHRHTSSTRKKIPKPKCILSGNEAWIKHVIQAKSSDTNDCALTWHTFRGLTERCEFIAHSGASERELLLWK
jgi:hypothetical protein